ncbi:MAG: adenylate kinase, partial [Oscillospiraceae bacterium]
GRRTCPKCGSSYHIQYKVPSRENICDKCGEALIIRADDEESTVNTRLKVYHETTEQLKDYYRAKGKLRIVDGQEEIADTTRATLAAIEE